MDKACAVVLHPDGDPLRVLMFEHPLTGLQLVKGGLEAGEAPQAGAARELFEETGVETQSALVLGSAETIVAGETWHFVLCRAKPPLRETWRHLCADDGGHVRTMSWVELEASDPFTAPYSDAFDWIRTALLR